MNDDADELKDESLDDPPDEFDYSPVGSVSVLTYSPDDDRHRRTQMVAVWLVVLSTLTNGIILTFQPLFERFSEHPRLFGLMVPYGAYHWSRSFSVATGLTLVYLALNLFHRKKASLVVAICALVVSLLVHCGRTLIEVESAGATNGALSGLNVATCLLNLIVLIKYRKLFTVRSEPRNIKRGLAFLGGMLFLSLAYGVLGFLLLDVKDFGLQFSLPDAILRTLREFLLIGNPDLQPHTRFSQWFLESLSFAGGMAGAFTIFSLFRPIEYQLRTKPAERALLRKILDQHGQNALDYYKLLPDKSYIFSANRTCAAAYRTALDVAVHLGDPVGPASELQDFVKGFLRMCHTNGWSVAFMQVSDKNLKLYKELGLHVLKIGEDAIVDLEKFSKQTKDKKDFRSRVKKLDKEGYKLERIGPPLNDEIVNDLKSISDEWLSLPGRQERTFSLGYFDRDQLKHDTVYVLRGPDGKSLAFVNQVKSYAPGEVSIDLMRHRNEVPNGSMDYLFVKLMLNLHEQGFKRFSLGLAALSGVGETPDATLEEKAVHQIYEHMNRFFSYKGLRKYKSKFDPFWEERFLVYERGTPGLIRTALAILRVAEPD